MTLSAVKHAQAAKRITLDDVPCYDDWGMAGRMVERVRVTFYPRTDSTFNVKTNQPDKRVHRVHVLVQLSDGRAFGSTTASNMRWVLSRKMFPYDGELELRAYRSSSKKVPKWRTYTLRLRGDSAALIVWLDSLEEAGLLDD